MRIIEVNGVNGEAYICVNNDGANYVQISWGQIIRAVLYLPTYNHWHNFEKFNEFCNCNMTSILHLKQTETLTIHMVIVF